MLSDKGRKTQEFLVKTAFDIIVEKGIEALSLDRIVERAGISKGALTYHFKNKHKNRREPVTGESVTGSLFV